MTDAAARLREEPWKNPAAEPHVRLLSVTKRFGDFTAVDNISLDIYKGEFFEWISAVPGNKKLDAVRKTDQTSCQENQFGHPVKV